MEELIIKQIKRIQTALKKNPYGYLLPCPFCGSNPCLSIDEENARVFCTGCEVTTPTFRTETGATELIKMKAMDTWNKRKPDPLNLIKEDIKKPKVKIDQDILDKYPTLLHPLMKEAIKTQMQHMIMTYDEHTDMCEWLLGIAKYGEIQEELRGYFTHLGYPIIDHVIGTYIYNKG